jgi:predicted ATPase/class 3 adenylate cyclase
MDSLPSGTVTFLFTDIEASTKLAQEHPETWESLRERHHSILHSAVGGQNGYIFKTIGDGFCVAFPTAASALQAALKSQSDLQNETWSSTPIKVRMGIHTGQAEIQAGGDYQGYLTLTRAQRVMSVAHGGQILLSNSSAELIRGELPAGVSLMDMKEHRLKGLVNPEHLWQVVAPNLPSDFPPLQSLNEIPNNLPVQLTSFIGREREVAELKNALTPAPLASSNSAAGDLAARRRAREEPEARETRLLTLTGSGGTGKTRLSLQVAAEVLEAFPDGVWLIELASLTDASQIIPAMAQVFGLQELPFRPLAEQVTDYLRDKKCLLILDNCEHLIVACARLADGLLHQCTGLKILASSREALGIAGEMVYHTPSLADPESTQLFLDRARAVKSNFKLTDANDSAIAQICSRLDGIPLAIELAAARVKLLSPEQIASRLDDMFRLLVGGSRTALPRQQTLRALIDWSYDLLSEEEKRLLQFASVFVGGWTLDALEAVTDDPNTIEHLEQLVNKSLLVTEERESEMRYFMLETIRQYAREKLFEAKQSSVARDRHFFYFNELAETWWEMFRSPNVLPILDKVDDEVENFRTALEWGLENHVEENVRLAANFCTTSSMLSVPAEGVGIVMAAIERARALPPVEGEAHIQRQKLIARALFVRGMVGLGVGNIPLVTQAVKEAIAISRAIGDKQILGYSLGMYYTASNLINMPQADEAAQEALEIFTEEVADSFGLAIAYINMARLSAKKGDESEKERYLGKLREQVREMPESFQASMFLLGMGMDERLRGNYDTARKIFEEGKEAFRRIHSKYFVQVISSELGHVERQTGNLTKAKLNYKETLKGWQNLGNRAAIAHELECFAFIAITEEEPQRAVKLFGAAEALRERIQTPMTDYERVEYDQVVAQVRSMLPEAEFNTLGEEGRALTMEQAIELAMSDD